MDSVGSKWTPRILMLSLMITSSSPMRKLGTGPSFAKPGLVPTIIAKLQRVQNNLARVVLQAGWRDCPGPLLKKLHWLPVCARIKYKIALTTFKVRNTRKPSYLYDLLLEYIPARSLRSEDQTLLRIPLTRSQTARRSFSCAAPTIWNSLNISTRQAASLGCFKSRLKTALFDPATC